MTHFDPQPDTDFTAGNMLEDIEVCTSDESIQEPSMTTSISAAIASPEGGPFIIDQVELDAPRDDEILVEIKAVGLCHTDVVAQAGAFDFGLPVVLGHEGAGIVRRVGANITRVVPGDRVALSFRSCGACSKCDDAHPAYCHTMPALNYGGMRTDGSRTIHKGPDDIAGNFFGQSSFASHALTYERNIVKIPDDVPFEIAAPLGCGVQTGAGSILNAMDCEAGSALLVTGGGTVGLSAVMGAKLRTCATIIVVEPIAARRDMAVELGATHTIDPMAQDNLAAAIREISTVGVDYALDTTGRADVLEAIMQGLAPQGTLGLVGIAAPGSKLPGEVNQVISLGHKVMGIIEGDSEPSAFIPELMEHFLAGDLPVDRLLSRYRLDQINEAVADQHSGKCIKPILSFE
ncbi:NAD(P)-dependent alcohol dehydrogenase [Pseudopontixanthobacter vadosimaris]|uniref:NAD(P)-dependent alcohol dehydrogenase n=1 Tax=Pseudopontixanthobacter vadosimaris TaxID=2726450 RepID=UPI001F115939|nr:NAD(P)-dependent alcohol dehydrogenase [Pseudopontixanthobacter vadosimaris]